MAYFLKGSDHGNGFLGIMKRPTVSAAAAEAGTPQMVLQRI